MIELVKLNFCPEKSDLRTENPSVLEYLWEWKKFSLVHGVLYRNTTVNNVQIQQLVLPLHFRAIVLKSSDICMMILAIKDEIVYYL